MQLLRWKHVQLIFDDVAAARPSHLSPFTPHEHALRTRPLLVRDEHATPHEHVIIRDVTVEVLVVPPTVRPARKRAGLVVEVARVRNGKLTSLAVARVQTPEHVLHLREHKQYRAKYQCKPEK